MDATTYPASFLDVPQSERRPMTEDETKSFMSAIMADMQDSTPGDFSKLEGCETVAKNLQKSVKI